MNVLSIDIGVVNMAFFAMEMSQSDAQKEANCKNTVVTGKCIDHVNIVDFFHLNLGSHLKGLQCIDNLAKVWGNLVLFQCWTPDIVLIEMQVKYAVKNKLLSIATYTLCKQMFPECSVKFVRPLSKFEGYKRFFPSIHVPFKLSNYRQRKKAAVDITKDILDKHFNHQTIESMSRSEASDEIVKKLDDFSDAFLQAFCI
jgi:ribosome-associated toxin RatA of RatAB toxin-antitoxin module